ncbi:MAG: hypothetical protein QM669_14270 [Siphonobacter sp.]
MKKSVRLSISSLFLAASLLTLASCQREADDITPTKTTAVQDDSETVIPPVSTVRK